MQSIKDKIWSAALQAIKVRPHSEADLRKKLAEKFPDETSIISDTISEMKSLQLISDRRYSEQLIRHLTLKPIGRYKIMNECRKRGLDEDLVQTTLMEANYNEEEMAQTAFELKNKVLREEDPRKRKQKIMHFLRGRGFTDTVIYKTLSAGLSNK